mmetsp:Transcript_2359/g.7058  ORF Transcript_2359/g.7058 Transcript_2359/m.7058 type:complete len:288 (+) Transcript_2359:133-996(+)|eukprot:CAMPEP_0198728162 /NCGR_PEP_ID=MMETSP1475-20131203/7524_1 /TAXON_ID= ORGANISM="Unidentified sp., Strain CCMP1999" /NCGR_SAMPLE_ID=MMETSP1475 /ASSEMBLY_ACC=CAM_ASM_001111 /LENGTH=287 /DNA_ID=CAMNT_0044490449 /DNA_START=126 /DNA_END=989 /DNA_ORIENTATION=+
MSKKKDELIKDGWFHEKGQLWPGQAMSLEVEEVLYEGHSDFQHLVVFRSATYGNVLVLDGVIQVTERDEFAYQEMMSHLPMHLHENPKRVLVVGGGDGGVLREVLKHPSVEEVTLCEIDVQVIEISKQYLTSMARAYNDIRVNVQIMDGAEYMRRREKYFDVIITDSSDPVGPAETLFQEPYFEAMRNALTDKGVICSQGECMWLHLDIIKPTLDICRKLFPSVGYAYTCIPTYPSGQIGQVVCCKQDMDVTKPLRACTIEGLRYYSSAIHGAAFVLPEFCRKAIGK